MDKFPLYWDGQAVGEVAAEEESLYTRFSACCRLPEEGLWCVWLIGKQGELRLGVIEPNGEEAVLCRRFSKRMTAPLGCLLRGELRRGGTAETWEVEPKPERLFHTPWLKGYLRGMEEVYFRREGSCLWVAIPYDARQPFPLLPLFCLAVVAPARGRLCAVFVFDRGETPCFPT